MDPFAQQRCSYLEDHPRTRQDVVNNRGYWSNYSGSSIQAWPAITEPGPDCSDGSGVFNFGVGALGALSPLSLLF